MDEEFGRGVLEPYHTAFWEIWHCAWYRWMRLPDRAALNHCRVRANVVWGFGVDEAKARFDGRPEIAINDGHGTVRFTLLPDILTFRLKKMDQEGFSSNYPTQRTLALLGQLDLPGIPHTLPRVEIGYVLNDLKTQIASVLISHRRDGVILWKYAIERPASGAVVPLPPKQPLPEQPRRSRIKPRMPDAGVEDLQKFKDKQNDEGGDGK